MFKLTSYVWFVVKYLLSNFLPTELLCFGASRSISTHGNLKQQFDVYINGVIDISTALKY